MTDKESSSRTRLRLEAAALDWGKLSRSQQDAFRKIVNTLHSATDAATDDVSTQRSRVLLVSGGRGTGKTTLVLSVRRYCQSPNDYKDDEEVKDVLPRLSRNIVWLPSLSMDPLPEYTNLLGAILARIGEAAERRDDDGAADRGRARYGLLDAHSEHDRALTEFNGFQSEALVALKGNLEQRSPSLDTDVYAVEAMRAERYRVAFARRFNQHLRKLLRNMGRDENKGVFVLPVDDFDANPRLAVEILKLVNYISVPRLFTIFMGSIETVDQVLYYQIRGELNGLVGTAATDEAATRRIAANANESASSSLRKMLPPAQRILLASMTMDEVLQYQQEKGDNLEQKLKKIPLVLSGLADDDDADGKQRRVVFGTEVNDLYSLLLYEDPLQNRLAAGQGKEAAQSKVARDAGIYTYSGARLFQASARRLADLWLELDAFPLDPKRTTGADLSAAEKADLVQIFHRTLLSLVDEDPNLDLDAQDLLRKAIVRDDLHDEWELSWSGLSRVDVLGDRVVLPLSGPDKLLMDLQCTLRASRIRRTEIEVKVAGGLASKSVEWRSLLSERTRAAFMVVHDLIQLTGAGVVAGEPVSEDKKPEQSEAYAEWNDGWSTPLVVPWAMPAWATFWNADLFTRIWNEGEIRARRISRDAADVNNDGLALILAYAWVLGGVTTLSGSVEKKDRLLDPLCKAREEKALWTYEDLGLEQAWSDLKTAVEKLAIDVNKRRLSSRDDRRADQIDDWLIDLALLLAPESGVPWDARAAKDPTARGSAGKWAEFRNSMINGITSMKTVWGRVGSKVRRRRLERIGSHIGSILGLSLLNPGLATKILDRPDDKLKQIRDNKESMPDGDVQAAWAAKKALKQVPHKVRRFQRDRIHNDSFHENSDLLPTRDEIKARFLRAAATRDLEGINSADQLLIRFYLELDDPEP